MGHSKGPASLIILVASLLVGACLVLGDAESYPLSLYRLNCGGPEFQDQYGRMWEADDSTFSLGGLNAEAPAANISQLHPSAGASNLGNSLPTGSWGGQSKAGMNAGPDTTLYATARVFSLEDEGSKKLPGYTFPIYPQGRYMLRLYFAAIDYNVTGFEGAQMSFAITVNGGIVTSNYGPLLEAGSFGSTAVLDLVLPVLNATNATILLVPNGAHSYVNGLELLTQGDDVAAPPGWYGASVALSMLLRTTHRINCGGAEVTPDLDHLSRTWSADYGYSPGSTIYVKHPVQGTDVDPTWIPQSLYQSQRVGTEGDAWAFFYTLDVQPNTQYFVRLHFAEIQPQLVGASAGAASNRTLDCLLNFNPIFLEFDVSKTAGGPFVALTRDFFVTTAATAMVVGFTASLSAAATVFGPAIAGIEVLQVVPFTLPPPSQAIPYSLFKNATHGAPSPAEFKGNSSGPGSQRPPPPPPALKAPPPSESREGAILLRLKQALGNPKVLAGWTGRPCQSSNWWKGVGCSGGAQVQALLLANLNLTGPIIPDIGQLTKLRYLWLNGNYFNGSIPAQLGQLSNLQSLRLHNNSLTGPIPGSLANLSRLSELTLDNNDLTGEVPLALLNLPSLSNSGNSVAVVRYRPGNTRLCTTSGYAAQEMFLALCAPAPAPPPRGHGSSTGVVGIVVGVVGGALLLACCVALGYCYGAYRRKQLYLPEDSERGGMLWGGNRSTKENNRWENQDAAMASNKKQMSALSYSAGRMFPLAELKKATGDFADGNVIGSGGFGKVYRGELAGGLVVAVKRHIRGSGQGHTQFFMELEVLSKVRHRHLVSLIGYCHEKNEMILVYEFMPGGTLRDHICSRATATPLSWKKRLEIAIGAARGVEYLHHGLAPAIIHRDLKSTNILLDGALRAKVGDFGLSRNGPEGDMTHISTVVRGSFGYVDPEYYKWLKLTHKSDVYSFGVVLLEMLAGRKVIDLDFPVDSVEVNLVEWSRPYLQQGLAAKVVDKRLLGAFNPTSIAKIAALVLQCLQEPGNLRPSMVEVIQVIESALELEAGNYAIPTRATVLR